MNIRTSVIRFTESAEEELALLTKELRLGQLVQTLGPQSNLPPDVKNDLRQLLLTLSDMFSTSLPAVDADPFETLRMASRDINLARVLKERGLFRLYRLLNTTTHMVDDSSGSVVEISLYSTQVNPYTGLEFKRREEFIGWFCQEAHVARSLVFMRMATIDRLLDLGIPLEESFQIILTKPYAIRETLNIVAEWEKGELVGVKPEIATRLAERMLPAQVEEVRSLSKILHDEEDEDRQEEARTRLSETLRPALASLVREVANHPSTRDAMDFVNHDIAAQPEIGYRWDYEHDELEITMTVKALDPQGTVYIKNVLTVHMVPDPLLPTEIRKDLTTRLPVKNRDIIDR